ncbi:lasso peptide isopeptide bond-forming cyclase [Nostocaceae cyanobacterium CENA369]|uniref:asparagine synthase (glutamine-hydrolyzing) n=1 Tax=Dendronalium phyllosphericum CENA369 TaxID=1725256 RepID=A0A8J7I216_9NOST|nr:lasso peptide isopeptide bond-forming cyclase [Dendronalium phyllosphericum]MBH8571536.1 lasso peptide isopeptide bond-forming cyclase [Dendronalium phyllosphericum CENA369]
MSGIMGVQNLNSQPVSYQYLEKMVDILAHRGPDGADIWVEESVGFGHRMLWTTPESLIEKLPLVNQAGNLVITADARIDNREELIPLLKLPERPIEKITDSEFILAAYEKWGESCPEHLLGDFAFAIWDKRQQSLFCARDHFGVKPFYYYYLPNQVFVFASEIKALLCLPQVPRRLNEVRIADYLALMMEDKAITTYQDILRLPPAHSMVVNQSGLNIWSYWTLEQRELQLESNEAYAAEFRKIFTEAVRCRLRSAFAIAAHLSGGLDSSAITCVARNLLTQEGKTQLHTISSIFDKIPECDERAYINAVLEQGGLIPHYVRGDGIGPLSNLNSIFQYEDEALLGPSHFYPWTINDAAKKLGLRITLDGFDGDTTVSHGTTRLSELARQGKWNTFAQEVKALSPHHNVSHTAVLRNYGLPQLRDLAKQFRWIAFAQAVQKIHQYFGISRKLLIIHHGIKPFIQQILQRWHKQEKSQKSLISQIPLVKRQFAEQIHLEERIQTLDNSTQSPLTLREEHWRSLTQGILVYTLEQMDQYAAMFSLEARHPFMDKRLIEFCLALPSEQKLCQGWGRMVMRRALDGILPETIQWRGGKTNLTPNFLHGLVHRDRQILDEVMCNKLESIEKYINVDFLRTAYQRLISADDKASNDDSTVVWQAVTLALWLDHKQVML